MRNLSSYLSVWPRPLIHDFGIGFTRKFLALTWVSFSALYCLAPCLRYFMASLTSLLFFLTANRSKLQYNRPLTHVFSLWRTLYKLLNFQVDFDADKERRSRRLLHGTVPEPSLSVNYEHIYSPIYASGRHDKPTPN